MSLTPQEVGSLLTAAACYDNRQPNPDLLRAWVEAAARGRWEYREALDAVHEHYAHTTDYLMPGHITVALKHRRALPPPSIASLPEHRRAASPEHIAACMAEIAQKLGWIVAAEEADRRTVLTVRCPYCAAQPGEPCTRPSERAGSGRVRMGFHPSRLEAAEQETTP